MHRLLIVITAILLGATSAQAAEITGRYVLEKVEQGFLRLDSETGAMALCSAKAGGDATRSRIRTSVSWRSSIG